MKSAMNDCDLKLFADDHCIIFSNQHVHSIKKHLNADFNKLCERFIGSKLSVHEGKSECILFKKENIF